MTDRKRPGLTPVVLASEQVTERLNALYDGDDPGSALDEALEALQLLSLPADDKWSASVPPRRPPKDYKPPG